MNEISKTQSAEIENREGIAALISEVMKPVLTAMAELISQNTEAMEKLSAQQKIQSDRMEALERQIRLNTPVTPAQARYINTAIKDRAKELLYDRLPDADSKKITKLSREIRKSLLSQFGIGSIAELPKFEYKVAMEAIAMWNSRIKVREVAEG